MKRERKEGTAQAYNRCISNFANTPSKFLASLGTSDILKTLYAISLWRVKYDFQTKQK